MQRTFEDWKREADRVCVALVGLSLDDLPDCCFYDWYEDGDTPRQAARRAIRQAGGGDCL